MLTLLITIASLLSQLGSTPENTAVTVSKKMTQAVQQPQPRRPGIHTDQTKPAPDTTQKRKGRPKQPASVDSLRRGGATRVDTVQT